MARRNMRNETSKIEESFKQSGFLTRKKLLSFFPAMLLSNVSIFLLTTVDGLVVGNLVGVDSLSCVNYVVPACMVVNIATTLLCSGASNELSRCMGNIDHEGLDRTKYASNVMMVFFAIIVSILQIPSMIAAIHLYHLSPEMSRMTFRYAIGIMIASPFGLVSSLAVYQLQTVGKMGTIAVLSALEGIVNLVCDLLFVGVFDLGVAGAGYGTAVATIVRCAISTVYLMKKTNMFHVERQKLSARTVKAILGSGLPEASYVLMFSAQNYLIALIIIRAFGDMGGAVKGICTFVLSIATMFQGGVLGAMRPLSGLLGGAKAWKSMRLLMKQCIFATTIMSCILVGATLAFPEFFYGLNGVSAIPEGGRLALRIFSFYIIFKGYNSLFRLYFTNHSEAVFSTTLTIATGCIPIVLALVFSRLFYAPWLFLAYPLTEFFIFVINLVKYGKCVKAEKNEENRLGTVLNLTVKPENVIEASRLLRDFALENGLQDRYVFKIRLCLEEMVAYAVASQNNSSLNIQIRILFEDNGATFMMLDDGKCIAFDSDTDLKEMTIDNYTLIKKIAKHVEYQYLLNMNYTVVQF